VSQEARKAEVAAGVQTERIDPGRDKRLERLRYKSQLERRFVPAEPMSPTVRDEIGDLDVNRAALSPVSLPPGGAVEAPKVGVLGPLRGEVFGRVGVELSMSPGTTIPIGAPGFASGAKYWPR